MVSGHDASAMADLPNLAEQSHSQRALSIQILPCSQRSNSGAGAKSCEKRVKSGVSGQPNCPRSTNPRRLIARRLYPSTKPS
jgi:hypothetical protein